ncbi:basic amino acid ABC transporter substrate-binding protein [Sporosarcina sp. ACRSL]|uniref:basic amino acid ABC transporter substrate-binding protein n=1 Tax=Sporosarcina sp. ACRSL TaxID=2918215 RepID=UPI001EF5ED82|nr:basic amino acid ABC transporter substrate-binding protein [Sporosarcina sp. ACRSL]MCG7342615.1 basic amino acid ABC transporter substrate-binding protein [Sporosarcina sp. ACRSL]
MERSLRRYFLGAVLACLSIMLIGCGASSTNSSSSDGGTTEGKRKLIVGTDATYAPMEYMDEKGNIVGIDIDIVNAIAEAAGFEVEYKNYGWEPLFPALKNGEIDFAVSSITITDERKESYDFTNPYFVANQLILVLEDSDIESFEELKDKRVAVQINTTGHKVVEGLLGKTNKNILAPETMPLAISEMINGNADAAVGDNAVIIEYQAQNPNVKLKTIEDDSFEKEYYGLMVKKGNKEIVDLLNEGIEKIKANGKLKEITDQDLE